MQYRQPGSITAVAQDGTDMLKNRIFALGASGEEDMVTVKIADDEENNEMLFVSTSDHYLKPGTTDVYLIDVMPIFYGPHKVSVVVSAESLIPGRVLHLSTFGRVTTNSASGLPVGIAVAPTQYATSGNTFCYMIPFMLSNK